MPSRGTTAPRERAAWLTSHRRVATGLVLVALATAGCSSAEGTPTPPTITATSPDASTSATPAPGDDPVAPESPAALDDPGVDGAEALARYFMALFPYVQATGDLTEWERLSHPECTFCASTAETVRDQVAANQFGRGGAIEYVSFESNPVDDALVVVDAVVTQDEGAVQDIDGNVVTEIRPAQMTVKIAIEKVDGRWLFRGLEVLESVPA